jgi:alpha-methylacyl-CoA racemase
MQAAGVFSMERGTNLLDGGAHFYGTYGTKDDKYISLGSIEPQFYSLLVEKAGLDVDRFSAQMEQGKWVEFKAELTEVFKTKTRDEWCEVMEGSDVCFAPVLALDEVHNHPHNVARDSFIDIDGIVQPAPAPRFSRSEVGVSHGSRIPGEDTLTVLQEAGLSEAEINELVESGAVVNAAGA